MNIQVRLIFIKIIGKVFETTKERVNNNGLYAKIKDYYNLMFLNKKEFEWIINNSEDNFIVAIKYVIITNIIDFDLIKIKVSKLLCDHN